MSSHRKLESSSLASLWAKVQEFGAMKVLQWWYMDPHIFCMDIKAETRTLTCGD